MPLLVGVKTEDKWSVLGKQDWFVEDSKRFYSFSALDTSYGKVMKKT